MNARGFMKKSSRHIFRLEKLSRKKHVTAPEKVETKKKKLNLRYTAKVAAS